MAMNGINPPLNSAATAKRTALVTAAAALARAEHLSDVEPLRAESLAPSWGEGVAPAARSAGGTGSALPRGRRGTTRGSIRGARRRPVVAALAGVSRCGAPGRWR